MLTQQSGRRALARLRSVALLATTAILAGTSLVPLLVGSASAVSNQLEPRQAAISTAAPGATFTLTLSFDLPNSSAVQGIKVEFCDNALGTCGIGGGGNVSNTPTIPAASTVGQANWTSATAFGAYARGTGDDGTYTGSTNNQITVTRTSATSETAIGSACTNTPVVAANCRQLSFTGLTNNATANTAYYIRLRLYSVNSGFNDNTNQVFYGTTAQSTSQTITVNARVQEHLDFCVGTTTVDDTSSDVTGGSNNCANIDSAGLGTVDIGSITSTIANISPVSNANFGGNGVNGVAVVASNASNGTVISYFAHQDTDGGTTGHGSLKVAGASCVTSTVLGTGPTTDKCFNDSATPADLVTSGVEGFGLAIGGVNVAVSTAQSAYVGANLVPANNYYFNGSGGTASGGCTGGTGTGSPNCFKFAWQDDGTTVTLASSASSAIPVIDYEALILKFAARAAATTPTGQYTVQSTYIATSTY